MNTFSINKHGRQTAIFTDETPKFLKPKSIPNYIFFTNIVPDPKRPNYRKQPELNQNQTESKPDLNLNQTESKIEQMNLRFILNSDT